ncbi:protease [Salmonella enterica]|nr:protease [Salmonella enterica]EBW6391024.1 protease [Salmonella enterica subsp. enterica serovar Montevideo]EBY9282090.1 protease [Salmonella enterica subsp. enterica serovar Denver]ECU1019890.1 protease [Salmonella enterica subsp. enterica serovar Java]EDV0902619.1 protease [Salmonella enterica subsp. salamae]
MKRNIIAIGIAVLSSLSITDGWCQLLPAGHFSARDGRPFDVETGEGWFIDGVIATRLIDDVRALGQDVLIDYEHNQLRKDKGLTPDQLAAAGWFNADEMQWREGEGLFIKPRWTAAAQQRIDAGEFGYLSAVFPYDRATGYVLQIRFAALTNDPGATGMQKLAALAATLPDSDNPQQEKTPMNEKLRQLLARLGITVPENADVTDEQATAALSALDALKTDAGKVATLSAELSAAKSAGDSVDLTRYVPVETYNAVRQELAEAKAEGATVSLSAVLDKAEQEGRIFKSERGYHEQLGKQIGVAALAAQLEKKQPIAALTAMQTLTVQVPDTRKEGLAALSADEKAAAKALGMTDAEYQKLKEDENA